MADGSRQSGDGGSPMLSANATLAIGLGVCAALVVVALLSARFFKSTPPPAPAPVAPALEHSVNTFKFSPEYYKATIDEDAKKFSIPVPLVVDIARPLPYASELSTARVLKADRDQLDTPHIHLATKVSKEWSQTGAAQRLRVEHMMLTITNKSDKAIAYRVDTHFPEGARCGSKATFAHNSIALRPGETITRSECIWYKGATLDVRSIEVMELPDLGYYYVSRLLPTNILLDERANAGHEPPKKLKQCTFVPWREIRSSAEIQGGVTWADVIDFYARHNCDEYSFFDTYRRWTSSGDLPAQANAAPSTAVRTPAAAPVTP